ncbi:MAG: S8 family serine peptidase [Planctomycetota bacterium]|jgi:hypothetical protein
MMKLMLLLHGEEPERGDIKVKSTGFLITLSLFWLCTPIFASDLPVDSTKQHINIYDANNFIGPAPLKPNYVPNEIILKFRKTLADKIDEKLSQGRPVQDITLSDSLEKLNNKYRLKSAKPLFKNFKIRRQRQKTLLKKNRALLTKREKRVLRRLKRAPKNSRIPDLDRIYKIQVELESGQSLQEVVAAYNNDPDVEYAELNYIVSIDTTPNDPLYSNQWSLDKIDAPEAWDINTGSSDIVVTVVDTGVDYNHRDLDDNMWSDGNGYYGYDFINNDNDPMDDHGHGTHCAGIIAAEGNHGLDITGVCWDAKIMALKFLGANGTGSIADAAEAFYYAVDNGAEVISNSWSGGDYMEAMQQSIDYAHSQGVIMVAAAGNNNANNPDCYPANYNNMISVAATDSDDQKASFSNYGDWVDIAAPGVDILSLRLFRSPMGTPYDTKNSNLPDARCQTACKNNVTFTSDDMAFT